MYRKSIDIITETILSINFKNHNIFKFLYFDVYTANLNQSQSKSEAVNGQ